MKSRTQCYGEIQGAVRVPILKRSYLIEIFRKCKGIELTLLPKTNKISKQNIGSQGFQDTVYQATKNSNP